MGDRTKNFLFIGVSCIIIALFLVFQIGESIAFKDRQTKIIKIIQSKDINFTKYELCESEKCEEIDYRVYVKYSSGMAGISDDKLIELIIANFKKLAYDNERIINKANKEINKD